MSNTFNDVANDIIFELAKLKKMAAAREEDVSLLREQLAAKYREIAELRTQLPEEMKHCAIVCKRCDLGHAWLTATNWIQHGCPTCESDGLRAELSTAKREIEHLEARRNEAWFIKRNTWLHEQLESANERACKATALLFQVQSWFEKPNGIGIEAVKESLREFLNPIAEEPEKMMKFCSTFLCCCFTETVLIDGVWHCFLCLQRQLGANVGRGK